MHPIRRQVKQEYTLHPTVQFSRRTVAYQSRSRRYLALTIQIDPTQNILLMFFRKERINGPRDLSGGGLEPEGDCIMIERYRQESFKKKC